jgi:acetylornithine deacetylase/succinyl-diaminopimelate desuccinylase-like protein
VDVAPDRKAMTPPPPRADVFAALKKVAASYWPGVPIVPEMETGASDSIFNMPAGIPSYGINGALIDRDDVRAHGRDERLRVSSFDDAAAFYYDYLKTLTSP